jgi:hypothetical protein
MSAFDFMLRKIGSLVNVTRLTSEETNRLREQFSGLPDDYLSFLREVGFGDLGEFQLYNGPVGFDSIYPASRTDLRRKTTSRI